jgi:hypothetical protein
MLALSMEAPISFWKGSKHCASTQEACGRLYRRAAIAEALKSLEPLLNQSVLSPEDIALAPRVDRRGIAV